GGNLGCWTREIGRAGTDDFTELARGETPTGGGTLASLDPGALANGFYRLRLTAQDIGGRTATTETEVEVLSAAKPAGYRLTQTDLTVTLGGTAVALTRAYGSTERDLPGAVGHASPL